MLCNGGVAVEGGPVQRSPLGPVQFVDVCPCSKEGVDLGRVPGLGREDERHRQRRSLAGTRAACDVVLRRRWEWRQGRSAGAGSLRALSEPGQGQTWRKCGRWRRLGTGGSGGRRMLCQVRGRCLNPLCTAREQGTIDAINVWRSMLCLYCCIG